MDQIIKIFLQTANLFIHNVGLVFAALVSLKILWEVVLQN